MFKELVIRLFKCMGLAQDICNHCYHLDFTSKICRWKLRSSHKTKCKIDKNPFINRRGNVSYLMREICCHCGHIKPLLCENYDVREGLSYPEFNEEEFYKKKE